MIGFKKQFIFLHPPRTGGTSVEQYLVHHIEFQEQITNHGNLRHYPLSLYVEIFGDIIKNFYKFSVVRNPWDRMLSYYIHLYGEYNENEFDNMLSLAGKRGKLVNDAFPRENNPYFDFTSCTSWLNDAPPYEVKPIRFENLQEEFSLACKDLDIPQEELPWLNKSQREHYSKYYNKNRRDLVAKAFADDIENFNYKYETL